MAKTVNEAFLKFLRNTVNLDSQQTATARTSRDNLLDIITSFSGDDDFFNVYEKHNLNYGSFARHTKIKPLDDIDLMICFSAYSTGEKRSYTEGSGCFYINGIDFDSKNSLLTVGTNRLNSTKVINRVISKLSDIHDYREAEMHKNHEAATLQLKSYKWNFDIVPCFYTDTGFYLIPDGLGNWKKTDPRIDSKRTMAINQKHKGKILDVIRLMKYWNERKVTVRMESYLLECMILSIYDKLNEKEGYWIDWELRDLFKNLAKSIYYPVIDPKGIQGDLNTLEYTDRQIISSALNNAYNKAYEATQTESTNQKAAINVWREILGPSFPEYTEGDD